MLRALLAQTRIELFAETIEPEVVGAATGTEHKKRQLQLFALRTDIFEHAQFITDGPGI